MQYQDFSQIKEIIVNKTQQFFINAKIALAMLILSTILLLWQLYSIIDLYLFSKSDAAASFLRFENINHVVLADEFTLLPKLNIDQYHLFGVVAKSGGTMAQALKSSLPLILKGVMAYTNSKYGHAIIKDDSGKEKYYNIGDKISSNLGSVTLEYVFKDRVFIRNNGVLEYIPYPKLDLSTKPTASYAREPVININPINNQIGENQELNENDDHGYAAKQKARKALRALKNNPGIRKAKKMNSQPAGSGDELNIPKEQDDDYIEPNVGLEPKGPSINTTGQINKIVTMAHSWKSVAKQDNELKNKIEQNKILNKFKNIKEKS